MASVMTGSCGLRCDARNLIHDSQLTALPLLVTAPSGAFKLKESLDLEGQRRH